LEYFAKKKIIEIMNDKNEKITPIKNSEDHNKIVAKYEAEIEAEKQKALDWENACYQKDDTILELKKAKERAETERDDWKREASTARRVQQATKQHKEQADFKTEFIKLQQKKGWQWDESQGWTKA
jgi:hypothetical protein